MPVQDSTIFPCLLPLLPFIELNTLIHANLSTESSFPSATIPVPNDKPDTYPCICTEARHKKIKKYCLANRDPLQLTFDSMDFDIPEPTTYKYILSRGGLSITADEFREFLQCCNEKRELFDYDPFPGTGKFNLFHFLPALLQNQAFLLF